jgi:hypothetical protein
MGFRRALWEDGLGGGLRRSVGVGLFSEAEEEKNGEREVGSRAPSRPSTATRFSDFILGCVIDRSWLDGIEKGKLLRRRLEQTLSSRAEQIRAVKGSPNQIKPNQTKQASGGMKQQVKEGGSRDTCTVAEV